jgi:phosphate transport system protein
MPRTTLDRELQALHEQLLAIGSHVTIALQQLLLVLETGDQDVLYALITLEPTIDRLLLEAEERALRLLILQQPLGGQDLRFLTAALHIEIDLKRAGTLLAEMARLLLSHLLSPESTLFHIKTHKLSLFTDVISALDHYGYVTEIFALRGIFHLGQTVQHLLQETIEALEQKSVARAEAVRQEYGFLEQRQQQLSQELMMMLWKAPALSALQQNTSILQRISQLLLMTHEMKQLAQHADGICTQILFIVTLRNR